MRVVVADTGPLNYLLLIDQIDLLPHIFQSVHIPQSVRVELAHARAPDIVRNWIMQPPSWLITMADPTMASTSPGLDAGEDAAIALAIELEADLLLVDDRAGVRTALARGFDVIGTLGVLDQAASAGLVDLAEALSRLGATNFRIRPDVIEALLASHGIKQ